MTQLIQVRSPIDGRVYAERPLAAATEIERAVATAKIAQRDWATTPIAERAKLCTAFVEAMLAKKAEIATELTWQMGRPIVSDVVRPPC
jgi:acyl-CoA reductase-like NAD-dependent aldehyde dehydrogenase